MCRFFLFFCEFERFRGAEANDQKHGKIKRAGEEENFLENALMEVEGEKEGAKRGSRGEGKKAKPA